MSSDNPKTAIKSLMGRSYTFKGRTVRNSNLAMIALESAGIPLDSMMQKLGSAGGVVAWVFCTDAGEVVKAIGDGSVKEKAFLFADALTAEEYGQAVAIFTDCLKRFNESATSYFNPASKGKNK